MISCPGGKSRNNGSLRTTTTRRPPYRVRLFSTSRIFARPRALVPRSFHRINKWNRRSRTFRLEFSEYGLQRGLGSARLGIILSGGLLKRQGSAIDKLSVVTKQTELSIEQGLPAMPLPEGIVRPRAMDAGFAMNLRHETAAIDGG